jgi:hypothetical protein
MHSRRVTAVSMPFWQAPVEFWFGERLGDFATIENSCETTS